MAVVELYSKRKKRELGLNPDVYQYELIPPGLRTQVIHIWGDAIGIPYVTFDGFDKNEAVEKVYHSIVKILRREYSTFKLVRETSDPNNKAQSCPELKAWLLAETETDKVLDGIELSFQIIEHYCSKSSYIYGRNNREIASSAIEELNERFREHGVGYQLSDGKIIRVDSRLIHSLAVIPVLTVLRDPQYKNAQEEFLSAFEHYRHGNHEEALVDCCKAFESTMKVICDKRGWIFDASRSTASELIKTCLDNGLIPPYWESNFTGLRIMLTSGIPTARNRQGGHGAGTLPNNEPPAVLVSYVLHMTASTILFLSEADKKLS